MRKIHAVLAGVTALTALACGSGRDSRGPGTDDNRAGAGSNEKTVVYEVGGTARKANNISYGLGGNISQDNGATVPWKKESKTTDNLVIVSLTAQSAGTSGEITCKVTVDGKVIAENKSNGQYAVVTCTGNG